MASVHTAIIKEWFSSLESSGYSGFCEYQALHKITQLVFLSILLDHVCSSYGIGIGMQHVLHRVMCGGPFNPWSEDSAAVWQTMESLGDGV